MEVCTRLVSDTDDMVIKALSLALRELAKHPAEAPFSRESPAHAGGRVRREVQNKMMIGLKTARSSLIARDRSGKAKVPRPGSLYCDPKAQDF